MLCQRSRVLASLAVTLPEVASAAGCDAAPLLRTALRLAARLGEALPATDLQALLRRAVAGLPGLQAPARTLCAAAALLRLAAAAGLATGRQPRALAAAALLTAAHAHGPGQLTPAQAAQAMAASADTVSLRARELSAALCAAARGCLPYGADVTPQSLDAHLPFLLTQLIGPMGEEDLRAAVAAGGGCAGAGAGPPSFARAEAERARVAAKVSAARRRLGGEGLEPPPPIQLPLPPPPPPPPPRNSRALRPLGSKRTRGPSRRAVAACTGQEGGLALLSLPSVDAEDAEAEALLRAGVPEVRAPDCVPRVLVRSPDAARRSVSLWTRAWPLRAPGVLRGAMR